MQKAHIAMVDQQHVKPAVQEKQHHQLDQMQANVLIVKIIIMHLLGMHLHGIQIPFRTIL